jgi:hypothetical protein
VTSVWAMTPKLAASASNRGGKGNRSTSHSIDRIVPRFPPGAVGTP